MKTETMTIHQALIELKTLDKRISAKIDEQKWCAANRHSNSKIGGKSIEEFKTSVREQWQSLNDLFARRAALRRAVGRSNAETTVDICGVPYTVSEAIEMRDRGIAIKNLFMGVLAKQNKIETQRVEQENLELTGKADDYITRMFGTKDKANADDVKKLRDAYIEANTWEFIDPLGLDKKIEALKQEIEDFNSAVDCALSVSNAVTTVTIEY